MKPAPDLYFSYPYNKDSGSLRIKRIIEGWGGYKIVGPLIWPDKEPEVASNLLKEIIENHQFRGEEALLAKWDFNTYCIPRLMREAMVNGEAST